MKYIEREYHPLAQLMSDVSEDAYSAGWLMGNEYVLWAIMTEQMDNHYGFLEVPPEVVAQLRRHHEELGGWVIWVGQEDFGPLGISLPEGADPWDFTGNYFITTEKWLPMFESWKAANAANGYPLRRLTPEERAQVEEETMASMRTGLFNFEGARAAVEALRKEKGWKPVEPFYGA